MGETAAGRRVLLLNPAWKRLEEPFEHLGLGCLAASLRRAGIDTVILDEPLCGGRSGTLQLVREGGFGLIGVSVTFQEGAAEALTAITRLKAATGVPVAIGGIYPTFAAEEILSLYPAVDFIVKGEGEETLPELAETLFSGGDVKKVPGLVGRTGTELWETPDRPGVADLDTLPWPARDTLPAVLKRTGVASLLSSRGCYGRCSFCSVDAFFSRFGAKMRRRSTEDVLAEMEELIGRYGVSNFSFNDANFIGGKGRGRERAREIADGILQKGWKIKFSIECRVTDVDKELFSLLKQAGLCKVFLGVESGSQSVLDRFRKDATVEENMRALEILSGLDLFVAMGFIMFDSKTTFAELNENIQFLQQVKAVTGRPYLAQVDPVSKLLPFAGTKAEADLKAEGRYRGNTLSFSYCLKDPKVEALYRLLCLFTGAGRKLRTLRGKSLYREYDWQTGTIKD